MPFWSRSRRRNWYIHKRQQIRFTSTLLVQATAVLGLYSALALAVGIKLRLLTRGLVRPEEYPQIAGDLAGSTKLLVIELAAVFALTVVGLFVIGIYGSHKIAGPSLRLRRMLAEIAVGDASQRAAFRRRDRLAGLASDLNQTVGRIDGADAQLKAEIPFLGLSVQALATSLEEGELDESELRKLQDSLGRMVEGWRRNAPAAAPAAPEIAG